MILAKSTVNTRTDMTIAEYLIAFSECRTALSDLFVRQASECGRLYCDRAGDEYRGFLCTAVEEHTERVLYAYTKPAFRGRGVFTSLLEHAVEEAQGDVRLAIPENHPCFAAIEAVCRRLGFDETERVHVFSFDRGSREAWLRLKKRQRYDDCCALLDRCGYEAVSFAVADGDLLRQLEESPTSAFRNRFNPAAYLRHPSKCLSRELSFAAVKDGALAAYILMAQTSADTVVAEHMSASAACRDSGVILLPLVRAVDRFFESGLRVWSFAIHPSNTASNRIRENLEQEFVFTDRVTRNYYNRKTVT